MHVQRAVEPHSIVRQLLEQWSLPRELIDQAVSVTLPHAVLSGKNRLFRTRVDAVGEALQRNAQAALHILQKLEVDATLVALSRHYASLQNCLVAPDVNRLALAGVTRDNILPVVKRLGMWQFKRDLEDCVLQLIDPVGFDRVRGFYDRFKSRNRDLTSWLRSTLEERCASILHECKVSVLYCGLEGAHRRLLQVRDLDSSRIEDFATLHIMAPSIPDCYRALAAVHTLGLPEPAGLEDLIAVPRANGFSCLRTRICITPDLSPGYPFKSIVVFQVLIQTPAMAGVANQGITYPDCYKAIAAGLPVTNPDDEGRCVAHLVSGLTEDPRARRSEITVFVTNGERGKAVQLLAGSTALDVAYRVHTSVGNRAVSAEINGRGTSLNTQLKHSDMVRIIVDDHENQRTEADLEFVSLSHTRRKIRKALYEMGAARKGKLLLSTYLRHRNFSISSDDLDAWVDTVGQLWSQESRTDPSELYAAIAESKDYGTRAQVSPGMVGAEVMRLRRLSAPGLPYVIAHETPAADWMPALETDIQWLEGPSTFRRCGVCRPSESVSIVGLLRRNQVSVHSEHCYLVRGKDTVHLTWRRIARMVKCRLSIQALDRQLLVHNITEALYRRGCGLAQIDAKALDYGQAVIHLHLFVGNAVELAELMLDLRTIRSVQDVKLESCSLTTDLKERLVRGPINRALIDDLVREGFGKIHSIAVGGSSTSLRHHGISVRMTDQKPTFVPELFFGRKDETTWLLEHTVASGGGLVLVHGPKRIGKTSLCLRFLDKAENRQRCRVVRVDLRSHLRSSSGAVLRYIGEHLGQEIGLEVRSLPVKLSAMDLVELVQRTITAMNAEHLVLILDEMGAVFKSYASGLLGTELLEFLNSSMDMNLPLSIILVSPPEGLDQMDVCGGWAVLRQMPSLLLGPLELDAVKEMVGSAVNRWGLNCAESAQRDIEFLTGQYPVYIIHLLKEIANDIGVHGSKVYISASDVRVATSRLLHMDTIFQYHLADARHIPLAYDCLHALASFKFASREPVSAARLLSRLRPLVENAQDRDVTAALDRLAQNQVLNAASSASHQSTYRFAVPLFHHWLRKREAMVDASAE